MFDNYRVSQNISSQFTSNRWNIKTADQCVKRILLFEIANGGGALDRRLQKRVTTKCTLFSLRTHEQPHLKRRSRSSPHVLSFPFVDNNPDRDAREKLRTASTGGNSSRLASSLKLVARLEFGGSQVANSFIAIFSWRFPQVMETFDYETDNNFVTYTLAVTSL